MTTDLTVKATSPLATWLCYLEQQHPKAIDLGLERVAKVAERLDVLRPAPFVFTVAGTNGKGTTCRMLEAMLLASGRRVGVYSSPHLLRYTERVRIQGGELQASQHCEAFAAVEAQRDGVPLTYFEYGTLAALWLFKQAQLDVIILEVGLGGRLDATNIVDCDVAVITSIGLDHTDWLGHDRQSIGREKAGIFRADKPAVVGEMQMPASIAEVAAKIGARLLTCGKEWHYFIDNDVQTGGFQQNSGREIGAELAKEITVPQSASWRFADQQGEISQLPLPYIPLANAATALAALRISGLSVSHQQIRHGLAQATLAGRFQLVAQTPRIILDVAHNPQAAAWLAQRLRVTVSAGRLLAVVAMLGDKDIAGTLAELATVVDSWYCASLQGARAASGQQLAAHLPQSAREVTEVYDTVTQALQRAIDQAGAADTVLVCGSFYTVAQAMQDLDVEENQSQITQVTATQRVMETRLAPVQAGSDSGK